MAKQRLVAQVIRRLRERGEPLALRQQVVANVGLYFAAYHLSQMGWNVMPTARNARGIDLLAYDIRGGRKLGIQVKALQHGPTSRLAAPLTGSWEIGDHRQQDRDQ